jgi:hypothetical protein
LIEPAVAQTNTRNAEAIKPDWLLCQSGDIDRCNRLLRLPLDNETRALVNAGLQQARDIQRGQIRALLQLCKEKSNIRACDRALRYNVSAADREEILEVRKHVIHGRRLVTGSIPVGP